MKPLWVMVMMHAFVGDQIFHVDLAFVRHDLGQARRSVLLA